MVNFISVLFWISLFIVFYTYLGYGILLYFMVKIKEIFIPRQVKQLPKNEDLPQVTLFIASYNEMDIVEEKVINCLELDYPSDKLEILWVTDGTTDGSIEYLQRKSEELEKQNDCLNNIRILPKMRVEHNPIRAGKAAAFNRGIRFVRTPIVVFTDANTMLNKEAVKEIVKEFTDIQVGCVAGEKRVKATVNDAASTEGIYWKYESTLKALDYRLYSAVGAAGELFAIRTSLFKQLDNSTLLDDFILSMKIAQDGYKIAYCATSYAIEGSSANINEEAKRKERISAGGIQSIIELSPLLNIFKYGILSFQYISHRVLRWSLTPILLLALIPMNIILAFSTDNVNLFTSKGGGYVNVFGFILIIQILFYILGFIGAYLSRIGKKNKLLYVIYYFLFMNYNVFRGAIYLLKKKNGGVWEKAKRG